FAKNGERVVVDVDVQLVPRRLLEGPPFVGADLRAHAEVTEQREGAPRRCGAREVEVDGDVAVAQVPRARRVEERGELGMAATPARRRDLGQLVPQVVRER